MGTWARIDAGIRTHWKAKQLGILLKCDRAHSFMVDLILWAIDAKPDGYIGQLAPAILAEQASYKGKDPQVFVDALREVGFLDPDGRIHDWYDHQGALIERREREAERKRIARSRGPDVRRTSGGRRRRTSGRT